MLGFNITLATKLRIQSTIPYSWKDSSIPYLCIHLTSNIASLNGANFPSLFQAIQTDLTGLARVDNSRLSRVDIYKMMILPKILYVLQAIYIPNRVFSQFHLQNQKPRLSFSLMTKQLQFGGLGLPNLKAYHITVMLDQARHWWHNTVDKKGVTLESAMACIQDWWAALLDPIKGVLTQRLKSPPAIITTRYWKTLLSGDPPQSGLSQTLVMTDFVLLLPS